MNASSRKSPRLAFLVLLCVPALLVFLLYPRTRPLCGHRYSLLFDNYLLSNTHDCKRRKLVFDALTLKTQYDGYTIRHEVSGDFEATRRSVLDEAPSIADHGSHLDLKRLDGRVYFIAGTPRIKVIHNDAGGYLILESGRVVHQSGPVADLKKYLDSLK